METNTLRKVQMCWCLDIYFCAKVQQSEANLGRYADLWALQCVLHLLSAETFHFPFGSSTEFTPAAHHSRKSIIQHLSGFFLYFPESVATNTADLVSNWCVLSVSPPRDFFPHLRSWKGLSERELLLCGLYIRAVKMTCGLCSNRLSGQPGDAITAAWAASPLLSAPPLFLSSPCLFVTACVL